MFDEGELRRDLAALLRDNREEVAERLERGYVEAYPRSRANFMAASAIHQWTLDEIENLAQVVESGDCSMRTYRGQYGDAVEDPHNPELTAFASYIAANLFEARQMAPFLFQRGGGKGIPPYPGAPRALRAHHPGGHRLQLRAVRGVRQDSRCASSHVGDDPGHGVLFRRRHAGQALSGHRGVCARRPAGRGGRRGS